MTTPGITASVFHAMNDQPEPKRHDAAAAVRAEAVQADSARGEMVGMDQGMRVLSYLIAGVLVYGGLGWVGDHFLGTGFLLPVGIVLGAAGGCYAIIRRYGQVPSDPGAPTSRWSARYNQSTKDKTEGAR